MIKVDINIADPVWKSHLNISKKIKSLYKEIAPKISLIAINKKFELCVLLTNDKQIQELNKLYRKQDKPTNVLSFPLFDGIKIQNQDFSNIHQNAEFNNSKYISLGDIIVAHQTILTEAENQNKTFDDHLSHLLIHSLLHLLGFDHEKKKDAKIMEDLEITLLKSLGIENPYTNSYLK